MLETMDEGLDEERIEVFEDISEAARNIGEVVERGEGIAIYLESLVGYVRELASESLETVNNVVRSLGEALDGLDGGLLGELASEIGRLREGLDNLLGNLEVFITEESESIEIVSRAITVLALAIFSPEALPIVLERSEFEIVKLVEALRVGQ